SVELLSTTTTSHGPSGRRPARLSSVSARTAARLNVAMSTENFTAWTFWRSIRRGGASRRSCGGGGRHAPARVAGEVPQHHLVADGGDGVARCHGAEVASQITHCRSV